jgi:hypothetical protein
LEKDRGNQDIPTDKETEMDLDRMKGNEAIEREALDWKPQGKMRRGRPNQIWRRSVHNEALEKGKSWSEVKRMAGDRMRW